MKDPNKQAACQEAETTRLYPPEPFGRMPRQHHANALILALCFSTTSDWLFSEDLDSFYLQTPHGVITTQHVRSADELRDLISSTRAEGLQVMYAIMSAFADAQQCIHGKLPEFKEIGPLIVKVTDILRATGRRPQGRNGGYSRREQDRACRILCALSRFVIQRLEGADGKEQTGPFFEVFEVLNESGSARHLRILLGRGVWNLLRGGVNMLPLSLLSLHPNNDRYAAAAGFYVRSLQIVRRNVRDQGFITLGTIERESGIRSFDGNEYRRLKCLVAALHKLAAAKIIVSESSQETRTGLSFKEPKTAKARRVVVLPETAIAILRRHKAEQEELKLALGDGYQDQDLVCAVHDGSPVKPKYISDNLRWKLYKAKLPAVRFHDLRHTHATILLSQGIHPKVVSERLGHSTIAITMDTYSHVLPSMQEEAARKLDEALRAASGQRHEDSEE